MYVCTEEGEFVLCFNCENMVVVCYLHVVVNLKKKLLDFIIRSEFEGRNSERERCCFVVFADERVRVKLPNTKIACVAVDERVERGKKTLTNANELCVVFRDTLFVLFQVSPSWTITKSSKP